MSVEDIGSTTAREGGGWGAAAHDPGKTCHGLTSIRGIAAVVVVLQHCLLIPTINGIDNAYLVAPDWSNPWLSVVQVLLMVLNGPAAVVLFFVLSGTVLTLSLQREATFTASTLLRYWTRRLFRLYPLLIGATAFGAILYWTSPVAEEAPGTSTWVFPFLDKVPQLSDVSKNMLGVSNSMNIPAWSISVEIIVSVIFPAIFLLAIHGTRWTNTFALMALAVLAIMKPVRYREVEVYLFAFFLGPVLLLYARPYADRVWQMTKAARRTIVVAICAVVLMFERLYSPTEWNNGVSAVVQAVGAAAIIALIYYGPWSGVLYRRWSIWLGDISYGIYLIHFPILIFLVRFILPVMPAVHNPFQQLGLVVALACATMALAIPIAWAANRVIELPFQNFGRLVANRLRIRKPAPLY
jgi:peptidoglycan/LPS O-acetylase OafA/YrhL